MSMKLVIPTLELVALAVVLVACKRESPQSTRTPSAAVVMESTRKPGTDADSLCEGLLTGRVSAVDKKFKFIILEPSGPNSGTNKPARLVSEFTEETKCFAGGKPATLDDVVEGQQVRYSIRSHAKDRPPLLTILCLSRLPGAKAGLGMLHETSAADEPTNFKATLQPGRPLQTIHLNELAVRHDPFLKLGTNRLQWSRNGDGSGHLYFHTDSSLPDWEFAPCKRTNLSEITEREIYCDYYGPKHPNGNLAFGTSWEGETLLVTNGQIVIARLIKKPARIYAVKIEEQKGAVARATYLEIDTNPEETTERK
jgi:hypothetical protein